KQGKAEVSPSDWPEARELQRDRLVDYFDTQLTQHFKAEEEVLFPLADQYLSQEEPLTPLLRKQHSQIRSLVSELRTAAGVQLENLLLRLAHVLEDHIRKEDRVFFQRLQKCVPEEVLAPCGQQLESYLQASEGTPADE
ncbi:MAG: hemerythrin domain-containing protein, partial [Acidobacteriota bacterium]